MAVVFENTAHHSTKTAELTYIWDWLLVYAGSEQHRQAKASPWKNVLWFLRKP